MTTFRQPSFAGGEIAAALHSRVDTEKYASAARTLRNMLVQKFGGASNRPGTEFVLPARDPSEQPRLIPFVFSDAQTYALVFGDGWLQFVRDGVAITETAVTVTGATQGNPCVVTAASHGYSAGDTVYVSGAGGMTELNGRYYRVGSVPAVTTNTFALYLMDGTTPVNAVGYTTYTSGGTVERVYTLATPYAVADLMALQYVQDADVVMLTHPSYPRYELARSGDTSWTLTKMGNGPSIVGPTGASVSAGVAGSDTVKYKVTAIAADTFEESCPGVESGAESISAITQANPPQITTSTTHGWATGDHVYVSGVVGMTELNNREYVITVVDTTNITLDGENATSYGAYTSGGTVGRTEIQVGSAGTPTEDAPNVISWTASTSSGVKGYNVYKALNGTYGLVGIATDTSFDDPGYTEVGEIDVIDEPPYPRALFLVSGDWPAACGYYQTRFLAGGSNNDPESVYGSRPNSRKNFLFASPIQPDDPVTFWLRGKEVARVRHFVDVGEALLVLTQSGVWLIEGGANGRLRHDAVNQRQVARTGSSTVAPAVIGRAVVYVHDRGSAVHVLDHGADAQSLDRDATIYARHLFLGRTVVDMAYQEMPDSIVWCVRDDGVLLGMTFLPEHQIVAWHRHETDGEVESVCAVPEGGEDALYLVVKRTIDGEDVRYIERMASRTIADEDDQTGLVFMDAAMTYDGRNDDETHTMTLTGGTDWDQEETLTCTSSASYFTAAMVGGEMRFVDEDGETAACDIIAYTSATLVSVRPHGTIPTDLRGVGTADWGRAATTISGLNHLEGEEVSVLSDGMVVASPRNGAYDTITVEDGEITLPSPGEVVHVGLPYVSDLETLDIDTPQQPLSDKRKIVTRVQLHLEKTRGVWIGPRPPSEQLGNDDEDAAAHEWLAELVELPSRTDEPQTSPPRLRTGAQEPTIISGAWSQGGRVFIRQADPLPMTILAVTPSVEVARRE